MLSSTNFTWFILECFGPFVGPADSAKLLNEAKLRRKKSIEGRVVGIFRYLKNHVHIRFDGKGMGRGASNHHDHCNRVTTVVNMKFRNFQAFSTRRSLGLFCFGEY